MDNREIDGRDEKRNPRTERISGERDGRRSNKGKRSAEGQKDRARNNAGKEEEDDSQELELTEETDRTKGKDEEEETM